MDHTVDSARAARTRGGERGDGAAHRATATATEADLGWSLGAVARAYLRATADAVAEVPSGPRGHQVLAAADRGLGVSQLALARHVGVDRSVMTHLLDDLESAGLVERRLDPTDRRARRIVLTDLGGIRLRRLERSLRRAEDALLAPLDPGERRVLRGLLARLAPGAGRTGT
jgi:DNA-binding MarR family transcriptional regulator